jgi:hypothetical protein
MFGFCGTMESIVCLKLKCWRWFVKVGDLVRVKNQPWKDYGIILEINGKFKWAEVYWVTVGHTYAFFAEDLEVVNEGR